ncbi:hypothetical protein FYJ61_05605 [Lactobacillus equicursoris]|uniref:Uncharacterized protein n=1 Tax=Lactobacillus equicursoris TaxID=420645 RepID=A0A844FMV9_9LACO|nr:hypothetical protein [Lactobacillus equicursoris]MST79941.1 hypothetical protein [Lactobacillus equicursoris]
MKKSKSNVSAAEQARRNRVFLWTVFVIVINALSVFTKLWIFQALAMVGTAYALYRIVVWDNVNNRYSRKYYDWAGHKKSTSKKQSMNSN